MAKIALVTGASRGIGAAIARGLVKAGYRVALNYRTREDAAGELAAELGDAVRLFRADVSREEEVAAMLAEVERTMGGVDVLVNNAGIALDGVLLMDTSCADWDRVFAVNVRGAFLCSRGVIPGMLSRGGGRIINISSMWGQVGASCEVAYSASKAALIGMTRALAKEMGPSGIAVNCVAPGAVETDMMAGYTAEEIADLVDRTPLGRMGRAEDVAAAVVFLAGEGASFITGEVISVNGGFVI